MGIEIDLGKIAERSEKAVSDLSRLNQLMAESRLLELEITNAKFGLIFTDEQRTRMQNHIEELKKLTADS